MGCVVSTNRLKQSVDFVRKECTHELGHVFGLSHCKLPCVMTFSNSVHEANQKQSTLCESCRNKVYNNTLSAKNKFIHDTVE